MRSKRSLRISLENRLESLAEGLPEIDQPILTNLEEDVDMVPGTDITLATDVIAAQQDAGEAVDALDKLSAVTEQLETVRENIAATLPNGGLTQAEAGAYAVATDAIVADLGVQQVLPAMEAFGPSMSRIRATQVSMEALDGMLGKIADKVIQVLSELYERIANAVKSLIRRFASDVGRAERMLESLNALSNETAALTVTVSHRHTIYLGGTTLAAQNTTSNLEAFETLSTKVIPGAINQIMRGGDVTGISIGKSVTFAGEFALMEKRPAPGEHMDTYEVALKVPSTDSKEDVKFDVAPKQLKALLNKVISLLDNSDLDKVARQASDVEGNIANVVKKMASTSDDETKQHLADVRSLLTQLGSLSTQTVSAYGSVVSAILATSSALLNAQGAAEKAKAEKAGTAKPAARSKNRAKK